jgi:hypothetical protein
MNIEQLKERLSYCPKTGIFKWNDTVKNQCKGTQAGQTTSQGYIRLNIEGKKILAHRLAWAYVYGSFPKGHIDHVDRNKSNNSISNLREVSKKENAQNRGNIKGAYWHESSKLFCSRIQVDGKVTHLGYFKTKEEAQAAYLKAKQELHPFYTT